MKYKTISLYEAAQQPEFAPIWAMNNVHKSHVAAEGDLIVGIPRLNGSGIDILRIERTWLPIDLTAQIPRAQLLQSTEFRKALNEEMIVIVDSATAEKIQKSTGADEERLRIESEREYLKSATGVQPLSDDDAGTGVSVMGTGGGDDEDPGIAQFRDWLNNLGNRTDTQVLAELKTRKTTRKEAKRILQKLDPVKHIRSKNLLARSLAK